MKRFIVSAVAFCLLGSAANAAALFSITHLTGPSGGFVTGGGINNLGQYTISAADGAYRSRPDGSLEAIGSLSGLGTELTDIAATGLATGVSASLSPVGFHAVLVDETGALRDLGTLGTGTFSRGEGVNAGGTVVGYAETLPLDSSSVHAFRALRDGAMEDLGTLGGAVSYAWAINDAGQIAGDADLANGEFHAFRADADGVLQDWGTLGGTGSSAQAINQSGRIAGYSYLAGDAVYHAAYADAPGAWVDLGTLGGDNSNAMGLNDLGHVVGLSQAADGTDTAFLWRDGAMINLNDVIAPASGWYLSWATAINNGGQIIGQGWLNGERATFLLNPLSASTVPEPAAWAMLMLGFGMIGTAARSRRQLARV